MGNNNMNNLDIAHLMQMLSKMDKSELENGLVKANQILQSKNRDDILRDIKKGNIK